MSLKTLDDIEEICEENNTWVCKHDLRQEAIKWIKSAELGYVEGCEDEINFEEYKQRNGVWNWIKHFFNIEESEL